MPPRVGQHVCRDEPVRPRPDHRTGVRVAPHVFRCVAPLAAVADESEPHHEVVGNPRSGPRVGGVGPAGRDDLGAGVEVHAFGTVDVRVAEQALLPPAERVVRHRHRDRHVDADHARVDLVLEPPGRAAVAREHRDAVRVRVVGQQPRRIVVGLDPHDRQHRAEDLVAIHRHRRRRRGRRGTARGRTRRRARRRPRRGRRRRASRPPLDPAST